LRSFPIFASSSSFSSSSLLLLVLAVGPMPEQAEHLHSVFFFQRRSPSRGVAVTVSTRLFCRTRLADPAGPAAPCLAPDGRGWPQPRGALCLRFPLPPAPLPRPSRCPPRARSTTRGVPPRRPSEAAQACCSRCRIGHPPRRLQRPPCEQPPCEERAARAQLRLLRPSC